MNTAHLWSLALDLLFPKFCLGCNAEGTFLCAHCGEILVFQAPTCLVCSRRNFNGVLCAPCQEKTGLRRFLAPFSYRTPLARDLIHVYKYERVTELSSIMAEFVDAFIKFYDIRLTRECVLVPIPLHRSRQRERGFNQAALLADELGRRWDIPVATLLKRAKATAQQITMESYAERAQNVSGAFQAKAGNKSLLENKIVILIDDVATSGATLSAAANTLRQNGAKSVWAIVFAKG